MRSIDLDTPVVGRNLIGREDWVDLFIDNFVNKPGTTGAVQYALVAPRRTGKTSILLETFNRIFYRKECDYIIPLIFNLEEILVADHIDTFPERYLLQIYSCIFNFRLGQPVYNYKNLDMEKALELSKTLGFHDFLEITLKRMENDRSMGGFPAFRVVALPGDISRETGQVFAVFVDEVQEALKIAAEKGTNILMAYRNCWDNFPFKKGHVYHIFTGSAATLMSKKVLGSTSCLFGRIAHKDLSPLSPLAVNELIDFHTEDTAPVWDSAARTALYEITGGHPFYAKCLIKRILEKDTSSVGLLDVEEAYKTELFSGIINKTLHDGFSKYMSRYDDRVLLEQVLKKIAEETDAGVAIPTSKIRELPGWKPEALEYLEDCDLIHYNSYVRFTDQVFRDWFKYIYWPYVKEEIKIEQTGLDFSDTTVNRLVNDIGFLYQRIVHMVISFFNGQTVKGDLLGKENEEITLPVIRSANVEWSFYWPSSEDQKEAYRFDVVGITAYKDDPKDYEFWIIECKYWDSSKLGVPQLKEFLFKERKFKETRQFTMKKVIRWFCSKNRLKPVAREFCRKNDIFYSSAGDVEELMQLLRKGTAQSMPGRNKGR